eukprot:XP_001691611.1 predicted protein [Chlamydomonas reinhardtii]
MARWPLQPVVNVGLQILLAIGLGWALVAARVLDAERYMPQVNTLVLSLAAYVLWICLTQLGILVYCLALDKQEAGAKQQQKQKLSGAGFVQNGHSYSHVQGHLQKAQLLTVLRTVGKNPLLWSLLVSLIANLSGLRRFLDPESPAYVEGLGFIAELLHWFAGTAIPVSLVSIGVWMYGKRLPSAVLKRAGLLLCLKVLVLPALQAACGLALGLPTPAVMALTLLALCPTATTTFVIAAHYGHGADVARPQHTVRLTTQRPDVIADVQ